MLDRESSRIPIRQRYKSVVEDMTDCVVRWTPDGVRTFVNDAYLRYFGLTREEAIGTSFIPLIHREDRELLELKLAALTPESPVAEHMQRVILGDDRVGWQHWVDRAFFDDAREVIELQSVGRDMTEWREREEELRETTARLRTLYDHAPVGIFLNDADGMGMFVNRRYVEITGLEPEQATLEGWIRGIHPEDSERVVAEWEAARDARQPVESRYRYVHPSGRVRWVDGRVAPVRDEEGHLLGFTGTLLDVTGQVETYEKLNESNELFRALCDHAPIGIFRNDVDGGCVYVNDACCEITGLPRASALGSGWQSAVHPEDIDAVIEAWTHAIESDCTFDETFRFLHADGEVRWSRTVVTPTLSESGERTGYVGCTVDITERVVAHRALERRLAFEQLISRLSAEFVPAGPEQDGELLHRGLDAVCEYAEAERAGLYLFSDDRERARLAHIVERAPSATELLDSLTAGRPLAEMRMKWSWSRSVEGEVVAVRGRASLPTPEAEPDIAWLDEQSDGVPWDGSLLHVPLLVGRRNLGFLFVNDDRRVMRLTDDFVAQMQVVARLFANALHRRETERRLQEQHDLLAHVSRLTTLGELVAGIVHELNQPMYAILNCAKAIQNTIGVGGDRPDLELLTEAAEEIGHSSERAGEMIRRMRDFVRRADPVRITCQVDRLIAESLELAGHEIRRTGTEVDVYVPVDLPDVTADPVQMQQVLVNLVQNAIDANGSGRRVVIAATEADDRVRISVTDEGQGFRTEGDPFEAFVSTKAKGMGMGLAICRSIVEAHDGRLEIDDSGPGGCVQFTLPVPRGTPLLPDEERLDSEPASEG